MCSDIQTSIFDVPEQSGRRTDPISSHVTLKSLGKDTSLKMMVLRALIDASWNGDEVTLPVTIGSLLFSKPPTNVGSNAMSLPEPVGSSSPSGCGVLARAMTIAVGRCCTSCPPKPLCVGQGSSNDDQLSETTVVDVD